MNTNQATAAGAATLNPHQARAVEHNGGPLLILAGAGSGKTRVVTHRIAHLVGSGVKPWNILALTFTNKAAAEMKERTAALVGESARHVTLCTFHSFCHSVLTRDGDRVGILPGFSVFDDNDQLNVVKQCMSRMNVPDNQAFTPEKAHSAISYAKNFRVPPSEKLNPANPLAKFIDEIHAAYEKALVANNAVDFDNLILKTIDLLEENEDVLHRYRMKYTHLLVDEYQDTNRVQFLLLKLLSGGRGDVTVVGDQDQSIYKWRGADITNIQSFEREFEGASCVPLEQNYRSTQKILDSANSLIRNNGGWRGKRLWSDLGDGEKPRICEARDEREEACFIADEIAALASSGMPHSDMAVLFRTRAQSRVLEETLASRGVPFRVLGLTGFYQRKEIKDIVCYLKAIVNPRDTVSLSRIANVPRRGIGEKSLGKLFALIRETGLCSETILDAEDVLKELPGKVVAFLQLMRGFRRAAASMTVPVFLEHIFNESGYAAFLKTSDVEESTSRAENVRELLSITVEMAGEGGDTSLESFLTRVSLASDQDGLRDGDDSVKLMTLHSAKGLEFPAVFIAGAEEGLLPHHSSKYNRDELEEERRLCYVGVTRAMKRLYLVHATSRLLFGNIQHNNESRFIFEMGEANLLRTEASSGPAPSAGDWWDDEPKLKKPAVPLSFKPAPPPKYAPDFAAGDKVRHQIWGEGCIVSVKDDEVCIAFPGKGIKRLAARYAPIEKL